jgi:RNA polymerase sigma-70 factor (ECF subfamily)
MDELGDEALVAAAAGGDELAFKTLMERYAPIISGYFHGKLRHGHEMEDILQEVFLAAYQHLGRLRKSGKFRAWIFKVARHKLVDVYRAQIRHPLLVQSSSDPDAEEQELLDNFADPAPNPAERLRQTEFARILAQSMGKLSDKYRVLLYLRHHEEITVPEIARRLGLKESAVKMRLMRGLRLLRKELKRRGITSPLQDEEV